MSEEEVGHPAEEIKVQIGTTPSHPDIFIEIKKDGPYIVHGAPRVVQKIIQSNAHGISTSFLEGREFAMEETSSLCRCGQSSNAPYCDGSHLRSNVDLQEVASYEPLLANSELIQGPTRSLTDNDKYCAFGRFCDAAHRVWNEVLINSAQAEKNTEHMVHHCPGGRLLVWDNKYKKPIEDKVEPCIGLIEDPKQECSGPLAVWGGIRIQGASGESYEIRTRQALCRCGLSSNKPFCDGTHASAKYKDGIEP